MRAAGCGTGRTPRRPSRPARRPRPRRLTGVGVDLRAFPGLDGPDLPRRLAAVDEVEHADDLVRRQAAQHRQPDVAVALEAAQDQRDDEHLLVVADVAMVVVPGRQADVEPRVLLDQLPMHRPDQLQLAVGRRQQRVQDLQPQVLLVCHDSTILTSERTTAHDRMAGGERPPPPEGPRGGLYARAIGYGPCRARYSSRPIVRPTRPRRLFGPYKSHQRSLS